ncbi:MAG TPA: DNA adenine methylase, partial [Dehalococcoidia bacterium]|nr:DNA adenine methylase [Dehalococcoidia bacterium]
AALGAAELVYADYRVALRRANPGDFAYLDPPYHPLSSTANFTGYTPLGFGEGEQRELAREVDRLTKVGVAVLLSNSDTPLIRELYAAYEMTEIEVPRSINSRPDRRKGVGELLISNYARLQKGPSANGIMQEAAAM